MAALCSLLALAPGIALADPPGSYQGDPGHSGFAAAGSAAPPLGKRWIRDDIGQNVSYPVIAEGKVFASTSNGVYALDLRSGATVWFRSLETTGPYNVPGVAYDAGRVFVVDSHSVMHALSAAAGSPLWTASVAANNPDRSSPTAYGGDIVYTAGGSTVFGVRESDGAVLFSSVADADPVTPAVDSDRVYSVRECYASALQRTLGVLAWRHTESSCAVPRSSLPTLYGGRLYVLDGAAGAVLDSALGTVVGSFAATQPPAFADGVGYFADDKTLTARSLGSGSAVWQDHEVTPIVAPPLVTAGHVFGVTTESALGDKSKVFAVERSSGRRVWEDEVPVPFSSWNDTKLPGMATAGDTLVLSNYWKLMAWSPGPDAPGVIRTSPAKLSLSARPSRLTFGETTKLTGTLRGVMFQPWESVNIRASAFPYRSSTVVDIAHPNRTGAFAVKIKPTRNTVYTATYAGAESNRAVVFTGLGLRGYLYGHRPRLRVRVHVYGPPDVKLSGRAAFVYVYRAKRNRAVRVGTGRLKGRRTGYGDARIRLRAPRHRHGDVFFYCLRERQDDGFGKPDPSDADCGKRIIR